MRKRILNQFDCIECGYIFDVDDATRMGNTVWCPVCGRANGIDWYTLNGFQIKKIENDDEVEDEPYIDGCFSGDVEETNDVYANICEGTIKKGRKRNTWTYYRKRKTNKRTRDREEKEY